MKKDNKKTGDMEDMSTSPVDVQKYLKNLDYPATKDEIIGHAASQGAGEEVMDALDEIEDRTYEKPTDVSAELSGNM